ncbi:MAG: type IV toxin-antitoxin system AbiEi family antitoxin domain-containing protein [Coriobacteriales bacterium]|jgi:predicted transcriptional regulator of viral defense system|nr:type IV toxin-antitoxin system AbiEi family antitoxin domain-containing protein [Coriobacteriales bacterium]
MTYYEDLYAVAIDNYGIITSRAARALGVSNVYLVQLARRGHFDRLGHGVYRLVDYSPSSLNKYAEAIALLGQGAYVFGASALALHGLAFTDSQGVTIASPTRTRKSLPEHITVVTVANKADIAAYEGIPSQKVADAFLACRALGGADMLLSAVESARKQALVTDDEATALRREIKTGA